MSIVVESSNSRPDTQTVTEVCDVNGTDEPMPMMMPLLEIDNKPASPLQKCNLEEILSIPVEKCAETTEKSDSDVEMKDMTVLEVIMAPAQPYLPLVTDADIRRLQADLLIEESRLILMKRIFQLQNAPAKQDKQRDEVVVIGAKTGGSVPGRNAVTNGPVHQNGVKNVKGSLMASRMDRANLKDPKMQSIMKSGTPSNHPRSNIGPAVLELSKSLAHKQSVNMAKAQQMAGHPVVGQNNASRGQIIQQTPPPQQQQHSKPHQAHPLERLEQQLLEEKVSLKRQMEKAILQIVPPKPPAPDMNFIPATVCPDFIALLGMELAASYAITSKNLVDQSPYPEPFVCLSCQENVCPAWKVDAESGGVVCESCFTASRTNAARLSHIENLKVAFADVVEKESELDRRHAAAMVKAKATHLVENIAPTAAMSVVYSPQLKPSVQQPKHHLPVMNNYHHANNNSNAHHLSRSSGGGGKPNHHQQQQQHMNSGQMHHQRPSLPPAPQSRHSGKPPISSPYQQLGAPLPFAPTSSLSSSNKQQHLSYHGGGGQASRQTAERQYLLDMISRPQKLQQQQHQQSAWRK